MPMTDELIVLNKRIDTLTTAVRVRDDQIVKLRYTAWAAIGAAALAVVFAILSVIGFIAANHAADDVKTSQVVNCQNANSTRDGQRILWDFVLDLSAADAGPAETAALGEIRAWIHDLFAARDCADLDKKVTTPPPPSVKKIFKQLQEAGEE